MSDAKEVPAADQVEAANTTEKPVEQTAADAEQRDAFGLDPLAGHGFQPTPEEIVLGLAELKRKFGDGFITNMHTAVLTTIGVNENDSRRLAYLLTAARSNEDAFMRCGDIIENMHGSDEQRRQVALQLKARFGG